MENILIAKDAKKYKTEFNHNFNHEEDLLDIKRILAKINDIADLEKIKRIAEFLDDQIIQEKKKTESKEVETILALIEYLSKDENQHIPLRLTREFTNLM